MVTKLNTMIRALLFHPVTLCVAFGIALFTSFFAPGGRLADLSVLARTGVNLANLCFYFTVTYFALAPFLAWGLSRYWPWFGLQLCFYLPLAIVTGTLDAAFSAQGWSLAAALWSASTSIAMVLIAVTLTVFYFRPNLEALLSELDRPGCLFRSQQPPQADLLSHLPEGKRGAVQIIRGANQYVDVTTAHGNELVRLPLKTAETMVPVGAGMRVHRSIWIAFEHVDNWHIKGGKVQIIDKTGAILNVGRTYSDAFIETMRRLKL